MNLEYDIVDALGFVTLSNPPNNTLIDPVFENIDKLADFLDTQKLKAVVIKGSGRHFSAGADLPSIERQISSGSDRLAKRLDEGKALLDTIANASVPVLALIRGSCLGAGLEIALACHFRFAAQNALLGFPESEQGLIPGLGGTLATPRITGIGKATELILTGRIVRADEAKDLGLVDGIGTFREIESIAVDFLNQLTSRRSASLIRMVMTAIHNGRILPRALALAKETELFCQLAEARKTE